MLHQGDAHGRDEERAGGEHIRLGQLEVVFFAHGADTDGHMDLYEVRVAPGARVPGAHHHVDMDEVIYGLEGVMTDVVGDKVHEVHPGERVFSPRGIVHYFANRGQVPARTLICGTPCTRRPRVFSARWRPCSPRGGRPTCRSSPP